MKQVLTVGLLLAGVSAWAQSPVATPAKLGAPRVAPVVRASGDEFWDDAPQPAAKLGPISGDVGRPPSDASDEERFNWGTPPKSPAKSKENGRSGDRNRPPAELASRTKNSDDRDERSARLKDPTPGRLTSNPKDKDDPVGGSGNWWDTNTRNLQEGFMALGDRGQGHRPFESDKGFLDFVSPISNPLLAEDPRAVTELRPLYIYQTIPKNQYYFKGGNTQYFGLQGRLAFTDRFSVVVNKLGGNIFSPDSSSGQGSHTGLSEIWLAPKFSFYRDVETQTLLTGGLMFQMPVGNGSVYQDTGGLSLVPYLSYGQQMWKTGVGTFSLMNNFGYAFGTSKKRSDYLYDTIQLSLDAVDMHRIYPVVEMSWFRYTSNGEARTDLRFEGRDLANIGSMAKGRNYLSIAPGVRFNITDSWQLGLTTEFPINGSRDLMKFRFGADVIWRY